MTAATSTRTAPSARRRPARLRAWCASDAVEGRIPGLDGLRAFAVIIVVAFHLWPERVPGGFIGVDVFFVISGFLITTLLIRERERTGRIDLPDFWRRRIRRLVPTLVVVVVATTVAARMLSSQLVVGIDRQVLGAFTFSSNWLEIRAGADYFNHSTPTIFGNLWSLAVEEQFYLVWPLVFALLAAVTRRWADRVRLVLGIAAVSAALMAVMLRSGTNPTRVYYGADTHVFGLMIGAGLAFAFAGDVGIVSQRRWLHLRRWSGFAAIVGLCVLAFALDSSSAFTYRGGLVVASLLSAVAVAALPGPPSSFVRCNSVRPLEWIGRRSYGIYLWHWPVIVMLTYRQPGGVGAEPTLSTVASALALTAALAAATHRWVEEPIRRGGFAPLAAVVRRRPSARLAFACLVAVAAGVVVTAPHKSAAQLAVEAGQQAIADAEGASAGVPTPMSTSPTTTPPPPESAAPVTVAATTVPPTTVPPTTAPPTPGEQLAGWRTSGAALPPGELISGFGDSVLSGAAPAMYDRFPGIQLDAKPVRQWRAAPALVEWMESEGYLRPVVVFSFGANAGLQSDGQVEALERVLDIVGPSRRVVLVNTASASSWVGETNERLAAISAAHPNAIVADWHSVATARPDLLHDDRTHPNIAGIAVYADVVAQAIETLGPG